MICFPNAKINLGLNVTERRPDGYHNLETVFFPVPLCDTLQVETNANEAGKIFPSGLPTQVSELQGCTLTTAGYGLDCPPESNLLVKTLRAIGNDFPLPHVYISLYKCIPSGAGLGGGSSDAAWMMSTLNRLFSLGLTDDELERRVSCLGADCAFFVRNRPVFATGIGNIFTPIALSLSGWHLVLVKPNVFVSTKDAYSRIRPHRPKKPLTDLLSLPVEQWRDTMVNDFEEGIFALHPQIANVKASLYDSGASYAAMSGSGSSVFGLFREVQDIKKLEAKFAGCFCRQMTL